MSRAKVVLNGIVFLAALLLRSPSVIAMDIVRDGKAVATIVVKKQAPEDARGKRRRRRRGLVAGDVFAAKVLVDWIKKMSNVELPVAESAPAGKPAIYVGAAALGAGLKLDDIKSPTNEGMRVVCDGQRVLLGGQNGTATVKAACRFLEELGCRYFMDEPIGEVFPRARTVTVGRLNITDQPGFLYRSIWGSRWSGASLWKIWNGAGGIGMSMGHAWGRYVPRDLFDEHPEYFPLRGGERRKSDWVCTSNPELRKIFTDGVIKSIEAGNTNPSVSPPDGTGYCQCPACRAQDDPRSIEPSSGRIAMSNRYADFFHYIGSQVAKGHPSSILSFYCYADYTQAPTSKRKLSPNLCAWIAPIRYCRYHRIGHPNCPSRKQLEEMLAGWASCVSKIAYRTYNFNLAECCVPFSLFSVWKHDIPYLKKKGCIGINLESLENWEIYGPHLYLSIRLAYSPDASADAIMDDYFTRFYGPKAGPTMKQYWLSIDEAFDSLKCHSGCFFALHLVYTPGFLAKCKALLDQAAEAAKGNKPHAARVALHTEGFRNAVQYIQLREAMNRGDFAGAKRIYDDLYARNEVEFKKGYGNHYTLNYLRRFIGRHVNAGAAALAPPSRLIQVMPDRWRLAYDREDAGLKKGYHRQNFSDSNWKTVATYSNTLNAQGLPDVKTVMWYRTTFKVARQHGKLSLFFAEIDGKATVYVNGQEAGGEEKRRAPFEVDISAAARPGDNVVAVRVDHSRITELFLGGIIRPVLLIDKGP